MSEWWELKVPFSKMAALTLQFSILFFFLLFLRSYRPPDLLFSGKFHKHLVVGAALPEDILF